MENQTLLSQASNSTNRTMDICYDSENNPVFRTGLIILYCLIFIASLLGNSLIITTVSRHVNIRSSSVNLFIANMAVSDILQTIFGIPRVVTEVMHGREKWLLGGFLGSFTCKLAYFAQDVSLSVSIVSLICITVERFYAVVFPFKYSYLSKHPKVFISGVWMIGVSLHAVYWKVFRLNEENKKCYQHWNSIPEVMTYYFIVFVGLFFLALFTTITLYTIIIISLKKKKASCQEAIRRSKEAQERKLLKVAIAITTVFFACFFPQTVLITLAPMYAIPVCHSEALRLLTKVMEQTYAAMNPILCMAFSANYRAGFVSVLQSCYQCLVSCCRRKTAQLSSEAYVLRQQGQNQDHEGVGRNVDEPPRDHATGNLITN